jgi:hypothetical protein
MRKLCAVVAGFAVFGVSARGTVVAASSQAAAAQPAPTHAVAGTVKIVDGKNGTLVVQASDGSLHVVKVAPSFKTSPIAEAAKAVAQDGKAVGQATGAVARDSANVAKEGAHVVVHYTEDAAGKTAHAVKQAADRTVQSITGVVTKVDRAARTVTVKTKDGVEHVYLVAKDATITTGRRIGAAGQEIGSSVKEGAQATVHFVDESGNRIAHVIEQ